MRLEWLSDGGTEMLELPNLDVDAAAKPEVFTIAKPDRFTEIPFSLGIEVGSAVFDWSLRGPDGATISSAMLRRQVIVLDFWASWCPPCIESMAALQRLDDEFEGQPVTFFGVQVLDTEDAVSFMKTQGLRYGILLDGEDVMLSMMGGQSIPSAIVIDAQGRAAGTTSGYYGEGSHRYLRRLIESTLARTASQGRADLRDQ